MFTRARSWLGDLANVITLAQVLVAGGTATILTGSAQVFLSVVFGLSPTERVIIGIGIFFVVLGLTLSGLKTFLERRAQGGTSETNAQQVQKDKIKQLQEHNKHLNSEIEERDTTHANRVLLKYALEEAQEEGNLLRKGEPTKAAVEKWESRCRALIEAALGEGHTNHFLSDDGAFPLATPNPTGAQYELDRRLQRLEWLLGIVDSLTPIQLRPEFNGREWTRKR